MSYAATRSSTSSGLSFAVDWVVGIGVEVVSEVLRHRADLLHLTVLSLVQSLPLVVLNRDHWNANHTICVDRQLPKLRWNLVYFEDLLVLLESLLLGPVVLFSGQVHFLKALVDVLVLDYEDVVVIVLQASLDLLTGKGALLLVTGLASAEGFLITLCTDIALNPGFGVNLSAHIGRIELVAIGHHTRGFGLDPLLTVLKDEVLRVLLLALVVSVVVEIVVYLGSILVLRQLRAASLRLD